MPPIKEMSVASSGAAFDLPSYRAAFQILPFSRQQMEPIETLFINGCMNKVFEMCKVNPQMQENAAVRNRTLAYCKDKIWNGEIREQHPLGISMTMLIFQRIGSDDIGMAVAMAVNDSVSSRSRQVCEEVEQYNSTAEASSMDLNEGGEKALHISSSPMMKRTSWLGATVLGLGIGLLGIAVFMRAGKSPNLKAIAHSSQIIFRTSLKAANDNAYAKAAIFLFASLGASEFFNSLNSVHYT